MASRMNSAAAPLGQGGEAAQNESTERHAVCQSTERHAVCQDLLQLLWTSRNLESAPTCAQVCTGSERLHRREPRHLPAQRQERHRQHPAGAPDRGLHLWRLHRARPRGCAFSACLSNQCSESGQHPAGCALHPWRLQCAQPRVCATCSSSMSPQILRGFKTHFKQLQ